MSETINFVSDIPGLISLLCVTDKDLNFFCILRRGFKHRSPSHQPNQCTDEGRDGKMLYFMLIVSTRPVH